MIRIPQHVHILFEHRVPPGHSGHHIIIQYNFTDPRPHTTYD